MDKKKCLRCLGDGEHITEAYEEEFDRLFDQGQFSAREVELLLKRRYGRDAVAICEVCGGTGFVEVS